MQCCRRANQSGWHIRVWLAQVFFVNFVVCETEPHKSCLVAVTRCVRALRATIRKGPDSSNRTCMRLAGWLVSIPCVCNPSDCVSAADHWMNSTISMEAHEPRHKQRLSSSRIFIKASGQQGTVKVPKGFANGTVRDLKKWYSSHDIVFTHLGRPMPDGLEMCSFNFRCSNTIFSTIFSTKDTRKRTSPDPDSKTSNRQKNERPDPRSKTSFSCSRASIL